MTDRRHYCSVKKILKLASVGDAVGLQINNSII